MKSRHFTISISWGGKALWKSQMVYLRMIFMQKNRFTLSAFPLLLFFSCSAMDQQKALSPKKPPDLPATSLIKRLKRASAGHHYKFFVIHFANAEYGSSCIAYAKLLKAIKVAIEDAPCHCEPKKMGQVSSPKAWKGDQPTWRITFHLFKWSWPIHQRQFFEMGPMSALTRYHLTSHSHFCPWAHPIPPPHLIINITPTIPFPIAGGWSQIAAIAGPSQRPFTPSSSRLCWFWPFSLSCIFFWLFTLSGKP